jgi:hypothetical protein
VIKERKKEKLSRVHLVKADQHALPPGKKLRLKSRKNTMWINLFKGLMVQEFKGCIESGIIPYCNNLKLLNP